MKEMCGNECYISYPNKILETAISKGDDKYAIIEIKCKNMQTNNKKHICLIYAIYNR